MTYCAVDPRRLFPDEPHPGFYIQLTEPNRGYRPGDTVAGRVVCQTDPEDETPIAVHVALEGKSAVVVEEPALYESESYSRVPLVWQHAELAGEEPVYAAPVGYDAADAAAKPLMKFVSFPFCFEMPEVAQETRNDDTFDDPFWTTAFNGKPGSFQRKPGHALPPTLTFGPRGTHSELEGHVSYRILAAKSTVRREQQNGKIVRLMKTAQMTQHPFWMVGGTSSAEDPTARVTNTKTVYLNAKRTAPATDRSLAQRAVKAILGTPDRMLRLHNEASMQERVYLGDTFEVVWALGAPSWVEKSSKARPDMSWLPGDTTVTSLTVKIIRVTGARTLQSDSSFEAALWVKEFAPGEAAPGEEDAFGHTDDGWPLVKVRCGPLPAQVLPSCSALNFYYQYSVLVTAKVECAGDKLETASLMTAQFVRRAADEGLADTFADMGPYAPDANDVPGRELGSTMGRRGKRSALRAAFFVFGVRR